MGLRRSLPAIDSIDAAELRPAVVRTRFIRRVLAVASVGLLAAAAASARGLDVGDRGLLPSGSSGVVVLDLSLSIADDDYRLVRAALSRLIRADAPVGLLVFSDTPYELLPPGTPASELRPVLRLLVPPAGGRPVNPWVQTFRAGTRISSALQLARDMLARDRVENGSILLVSDLQTAPEDVPALARTVERLRRDGISLRVVPLSPLSDGRVLFEGLLGREAFAAPIHQPAGQPPLLRGDARSRVPVALVLLGSLFLVALAAHERFTARLPLPASREEGRGST